MSFADIPRSELGKEYDRKTYDPVTAAELAGLLQLEQFP